MGLSSLVESISPDEEGERSNLKCSGRRKWNHVDAVVPGSLYFILQPKDSLIHGSNFGVDCCCNSGPHVGRTAHCARLALECYPSSHSIFRHVHAYPSTLAAGNGFRKMVAGWMSTTI